MLVIDSSSLIELLLGRAEAARIGDRALAAGEEIHAPYLLDLEIASALRSLCARDEIGEEEALRAFDHLEALGIFRHPHAHLLPRIWELRHIMTAHDAAYVALAETLDVPLLTHDAHLAAAARHYRKIELI